MQVWNMGSVEAAVLTQTGRLVWEIYNEGRIIFKMFLYYLTN